MKLMKSKRGLSLSVIDKAILLLIGIVILFELLAELVPEAQDAGDTLNTSGVPLGNLFAGSGVVFIILMAIFLLVIIRSAMKGTKGK